MSDSYAEFEDDSQDQVTKDPVRAQLRKVEQQLKASEAKVKEFEGAARELNFVKAGVNTSDPGAKYFVKGYDGDLSPEAIRVAAQEANLIPVSNGETVQASEQQAWSRVNNASREGEKFEPVTDWNEKMANAKNEQEVNQLMAQYNAEQARK
ncbi:hypothetical protein uvFWCGRAMDCOMC429_032 [Freshwater phage uvFW-CGR-AMD-COM-C429]|jgi:hypothetical protein|nr:hypothetical protein uvFWCGRAMDCOMC429_032 [Freshwater phage uvFW-CGR-AMD-COM-C429]